MGAVSCDYCIVFVTRIQEASAEIRGELFQIGTSQRGGGTYRAIFLGGKTYHKVPPPNPVLEASESGISLVCARFL